MHTTTETKTTSLAAIPTALADSPTPNYSEFIASTPGTRRIVNDPLVVGLDYTTTLSHSCAEILTLLKPHLPFALTEASTVVLHILRGGLNFGLREAFGSAFSWNNHSSAYISAQRAREDKNPEEWHITENLYKKIAFPKGGVVVFGDVVATGTSLEYALETIVELANAEKEPLRGILFFTIGGPRSGELMQRINQRCRELFPKYEGSALVYLEGRFDVATVESKLSIKETGTDLLRSNSLLAPLFIESQYENPLYPLERCTIYDAGSRAFSVAEYLHDVEDYWMKVLALAEKGMTFEAMLKERAPELDAARFSNPSLKALCAAHLEQIHGLQLRMKD